MVGRRRNSGIVKIRCKGRASLAEVVQEVCMGAARSMVEVAWKTVVCVTGILASGGSVRGGGSGVN